MNGLCTQLPVAVVDKYFFSGAVDDPFANLTARAICGHCPVRAKCLYEAITDPGLIEPGLQIRGGVTAHTLREARRAHLLNGVDPNWLTAELLEEGVPSPGGSPSLRAGRFPDATTLGRSA